METKCNLKNVTIERCQLQLKQKCNLTKIYANKDLRQQMSAPTKGRSSFEIDFLDFDFFAVALPLFGRRFFRRFGSLALSVSAAGGAVHWLLAVSSQLLGGTREKCIRETKGQQFKLYYENRPVLIVDFV